MKVTVDIVRNRLYLKMSGHMSKNDLEKLYTEVRFCVPDLTPGFVVIADYSETSLIKISAIKIYRNMMNYLIKTGVAEVIRIVDDTSILKKQVRNLSSRICGYKAIYASSYEEADEIISSTKERNGLRFYFSNPPEVTVVFEHGTDICLLLNLSTSGCALRLASIRPAIDEKIVLEISFNNQEVLADKFSFKAKIVWVTEKDFAVQFLNIEGEEKKVLLNNLIKEAENKL